MTEIWPSFSALALVISTVLLLSGAMAFFRSKNNFPVDGRTAIVTGGSQGLGLAIAQRLAAKGANVVIVAQDVNKLQRALGSIQSSAHKPSSQRFLQLSFDLRSPDSAPEILSRVTKWNNGMPPEIIFCCAGYCSPGFFASTSIETLRSQMDTVYWSAAYMAHAALSLWTKPIDQESKNNASVHSTRHIVFTSSTLAFLPVAGYSPYSPCKAAMRSLADSLNQEVAVYNGARQGRNGNSAPEADIKIHTIFPMGILSPGFDNETKTKPRLTMLLEKDDKPQKPEEVADIAIRQLEAGDFMITTMFIGHVMRGWGMGGSQRTGLMDLFWNWLGSIIILFVAPDFISKCKNWGKEKGIDVSPPS